MSQTIEISVSTTIDDAVREAFDLCLTRGLLPTQAARTVSLASLDTDDVYALAAIGLARLVSQMVGLRNSQLTANTTDTEEPPVKTERTQRRCSVSRITPEERREMLYRKAKDVLDCRYAGADGVLKALAAFTSEDHRYSLVHCDAASRGWRNRSRFHHDSLAALKAFAVGTINALPEAEKDRLRGRLR